MFTFIELKGFSQRRRMLMTDDEFRAFQEALIINPLAGDLIIGTGGFRKVRWGRRFSGKRGGMRVIYYYLADKGRIYLALVYPKNEQDDLSAEQCRMLKQLTDLLR
ncbi:type II toxin-antitoxin system RelE/ParE family toxin [Siccibacter colletis]|uniref:Type II toxin-antitoxin system RelE/ParE family toxin n=1 Tax=Siccibacter colletis TaxID=1505757 RepID=A0ABY6JEC4_9ENTR|nr:type II toxin-antitoxin system RelE/ParE family toxin [Siccibacter colletis]UYU32188.1 type II toxin-antitoxin system RelE/ParE family toxin [Siccibacter colletis]